MSVGQATGTGAEAVLKKEKLQLRSPPAHLYYSQLEGEKQGVEGEAVRSRAAVTENNPVLLNQQPASSLSQAGSQGVRSQEKYPPPYYTNTLWGDVGTDRQKGRKGQQSHPRRVESNVVNSQIKVDRRWWLNPRPSQ